jgi:hypothetical protein
LPIGEECTIKGENLPPSRVGAPDLEVVGFSRVLDIP